MKNLSFLFSVLCFCTFAAAGFAETSQQTLTKKRALSDLESIGHIFEVQYAPMKWKQEYAEWDLSQAIEEAKTKINALDNPTVKECQAIIRDFFNSTKDYHVGVRFYSTESASLPFLIKGAQGKYFVSFIDRGLVSKRDFPFEVGDEILTFGGEPIDEVIQTLRQKEFGKNVLETDQALAELTLTNRRADLGNVVPTGKVVITGKDSHDKSLQATLSWAYTPEKIKDFSTLGAKAHFNFEEWQQDWTAALKKSRFFDKMMVAHFWDRSFVGSFLNANKHALGARSSYIPNLGKKVWQSGSEAIFDAYIFKSPSGKNIGYIRIPHYIGDEEEVEEFGLLMNYFQKRTDALVIDQINNPGGSVFYLYSLAAMFADKPLYTPKHHIALTQDEVFVAVHLLGHLENIKNDAEARAVFGDTIGGYPIDFEFVQLTKQFCQFLISEWNRGGLYSDPIFLFGVEKIKPHPCYRYSKPVLVVINSLDFSCGDFFPAIMQDNKRATLFGTRTAGAGGYVLPNSFSNHSGIKGFTLTGSLAERIDFKPIENLGVEPDLSYELSEADLQNDYKEYASAIVNAVESICAKS